MVHLEYTVNKEYHLNVSESIELPLAHKHRGVSNYIYAGMPSENTFSIAMQEHMESGEKQSRSAYNLFFPLSQKELILEEVGYLRMMVAFDVIEVTSEHIILKYTGRIDND